jgi:hypothetical protein
MTGRMNWKRAHFDVRRAESKYRPGTVLSNGQVVPNLQSEMARRADEAMRDWMKRLPTHQRRGL